MPAFNAERTAMILVDALYKGDEQAAHDWGICKRSVVNYRKRLENDEALASLFQSKKTLAEQEWASEAHGAILAALSYIRRAALRAKVTPAMVHAMSGALKIVSEAMAQKRIIDVRVAGNHRTPRAADQSVATEFSAN